MDKEKLREILKFSPEEGRNIVKGSNKEFETISNEISDASRWSLMYDIVIKRLWDGKFFKSEYKVGATELQDEGPYEYDDKAVFTEVFPVEKIVTVYE